MLNRCNRKVKQIVAGYNVNYRQLNDASQMGLLFDIATLSKDPNHFYCVDVSNDEENGLLVALLLRVVFNRFLKATEKRRFLPSMYNILNKINKMLEDMGVRGIIPADFRLLPHQGKKYIISVSRTTTS